MTRGVAITFVSHTNKPGGGELALRRYLDATAIPVRLVTMEADGVWAGLACEVIHAKGLLGMRRALRGGGLVVANTMRAAFLTALLGPRGMRLTYWVRDGLTDSAMSPLALWLTKHVTARRADHYLANSLWTAGTVREALRVGEDKVDVVHSMCGVTEELLDRPPRLAPHDPLRILFLGRLSPWKAPDVAVRAMADLRARGVEATLTIAGAAHFGEDHYVKDLRALVDAEPAATLSGHVGDVSALLESHDVLVHCSTVPEPFGQVVVQALAAAMPVIATGHGGPVEILAGAPGTVLVPPGSSEDLSSALEQVAGDFTSLSAWGIERARAYTDAAAARDLDVALSGYDFPSARPD